MRAFADFADFLEREVKVPETIQVVTMLYQGYSISALLQSSFFNILVVSDTKYTLKVHKYVDESFSIEIDVDKEVKSDRFTH